MISFPDLCNMGRLGNQLFQMAATIALAADHGDTYGFPSYWPYRAFFPISGCFHDRLEDGPLYDRASWLPYEPIPYRPGLRLRGFFQSEKYFARHAALIRSLLMPKAVRKDGSRTASIHVRRGDYLQYPECWPSQPMEYYGRAVEMLSGKADVFLVFSDDPEWCRSAFTGPRFEVVSGADHEDLARMASCSHHITANSTFSWWGAWLNPSPEKVVVSPATWFGPAMHGFTTKDLIPEGWIVL